MSSEVLREEIQHHTDEYQKVSALFNSYAHTKSHKLKLTCVERVDNKALKAKFETQHQLYRSRYGDVKTFQLFHGTKATNIPSILLNNFDVRRHGQSTGHRFGAGVSFSAQASYASHYCDKGQSGQMLLCDVLVSNIINVPEVAPGGAIMMEPPYLPGGSFMRYDTTAKNRLTMDVVVKWKDHEYYPAYVINFSRCPLKEPVRYFNYYPFDLDDLCDILYDFRFS